MVNNTKINSEIKPNFKQNIKYTSNLVLACFITLLVSKGIYDIMGGANIFGDKNTSFFDVWSLEHMLTGMSLSYFFLLFKGPFSTAMDKDNKTEIEKLKKENKYNDEQIKDIEKILKRKNHKNKIIHHSLVVICIAFAWEVIELYMETATFKAVGIEKYFLTAQYWFSGVELFLNRIFVDVFLVYMGWYFVRHKPILSQIAAPLSFFWLVTHIIVFKDSMFLHKHSFSEIIHTFFSINLLYALLIVIVFSFILNKFKKGMADTELID